MADKQIGQFEEAVGGATVKIGRFVVAETGGFIFSFSSCSFSSSFAWSFSSPEVANVTPDFCAVAVDGTGFGMPVIVGAGNSNPSAAFLLNCLAKSLACHHSRNLSAKIDVGSKIFRLLSNLG